LTDQSNYYSKTKAIVPVHLFGRAANMEAIMAKEHNLYVIRRQCAIRANCSSSLVQKRTIGHVGATSFFHLKT
jgi:dTDP-4-amino-4,6-dideoxygalactose transaminase